MKQGAEQAVSAGDADQHIGLLPGGCLQDAAHCRILVHLAQAAVGQLVHEVVGAHGVEHGGGAVGSHPSTRSPYRRYGRDGRAIARYQANHQLDLTSHDVDRVTDLITACATAAGNALTINRISLSLNDPGPLAEQARKAAFASAQSKAEQIARLQGRPPADVVSVA